MPAEYLNDQLGLLGDNEIAMQANLDALFDYVGQMQALNFPYAGFVAFAAAFSGDFKNTCAPCFGPAPYAGQSAWYLGGTAVVSASPTNEVAFSLDGGNSWTDLVLGGLTGSAATVTAICCWPKAALNTGSGKGLVVMDSTGSETTANSRFSLYDGSSWARSAASFYPCQNILWYKTAFIAIGARANTGGTPAIPLYSYAGTGTTIGTHIDASAPTAIVNVNGWVCATDNASIIVCLPTGHISTTCEYMTSTDGATFAYHTTPHATNQVFTSLMWDPINSIFVAAINTGGGAQTITSADGLTWSTATVALASVFSFTSMTTMGAMWCAVAQLTNGGPSVNFYSLDLGQTWHLAPFSPLAVDGLDLVPGTIVSDGANQLMCVNSVSAAGSLACGTTAAST